MSEETTLPNWKASTSHPELAGKIKEALRQVRDPEIGSDVVQLGLIREIEISEKKHCHHHDPHYSLLPLWTCHDGISTSNCPG